MAIKHRIDELYTRWPFYGSRKIAVLLNQEKILVSRPTVQHYMREMGISGIAPGPNTSQSAPEHKIYPYLLRHICAQQPNHIWGIDITYSRLKGGWMYLVAILDWFSRFVVAWEIDQTLELPFIPNTVERALQQATPTIWNSDPGSHFTSAQYLSQSNREKTIMTICPWCGTNYLTFQPNCKNCGGTLQVVDEKIISSVPTENLSAPPSVPRLISERYVWRLLSTDGWWIAALVFGILGVVFSLVGAGLTISMIAAFVGIPFLWVGVTLLGTGGWVFERRYQEARKVVNVLRDGDATQGQIVEVQENYSVSVNGRHPWVIRYQFQADGQDYQGAVTTLNQPGQQLQAGKAVYVLYLPMSPKWSSIYPHP